MAGMLVGEAVGGMIFEQLLKTVLSAIQKPIMFGSIFERIRSILTSITSIINEIDEFNKILARPKEEMEPLLKIINDGESLIINCQKIRGWNLYKKSRYSDKLLELETALFKFSQMVMQFQQTRDSKETLFELKETRKEMKKMSLNQLNSSFMSLVGFTGTSSAPRPPPMTLGFDVPLGEVKMELLKDGVAVIVVSAPGGCGKTTLAKMLCHDEDIKDLVEDTKFVYLYSVLGPGKFKNNIFFVTVSKSANLKVIIQKLFQHKGYQVHEFQSDEDAVNNLEILLNNISPDPTLLVLDDVWAGSEFILDKLKFQIADYKILVTSRFVFPRFGFTYKLEKLDDKYATELFQHSAGLTDGVSYVPDEDLVEKIVKSCKGSPLALTVVGRSLCGQPAAIWQARVMDLSDGGSIFDSNCDLLDCLQSSLDALDNRQTTKGLKACYLDLSSFPEDQMIPAASLVDMWVELHNINGIRAIANLHELSSLNLIDFVATRKDDCDADSCYKDYFVRQHDLLRELAIYKSSLEPIELRERVFLEIGRENVPDWWVEQNQQLISARVLSIFTDESFSSTWPDIQGSDTEVLILNFRSKNYKLPKFMEKMNKLKTLIITNCSLFPTEIYNIPNLDNIKRLRMEQVSLSLLSAMQLKSLQKISLVMCNVDQVFADPTFNISQAFPHLLEVSFDYCNDLEKLPTGFCELVHLKKLSITNCHKLRQLPKEIGKLLNVEVLRLTSCIMLSELPCTIGTLHKLRLVDISDCLDIRELPMEMGNLDKLRKLYMTGCPSCHLPQTIGNLENLESVICDDETSYLWEPFMFHLTKLRIKLHKEDINLNWLNS